MRTIDTIAINKAIIGALGLDPSRIIKLTLTFSYAAPHAVAELMITDEVAAAMEKVLREYRLELRDDKEA